jgi:uncharacterized protein
MRNAPELLQKLFVGDYFRVAPRDFRLYSFGSKFKVQKLVLLQNSNLELQVIFAKLFLVQNEEFNNLDYNAPLRKELAELPAETIAPSPDNPPWNGWMAIGVWLMSILFIVIFPILFIAPYLIQQKANLMDQVALTELLTKDKTSILIQLIAIIPAHIFTLLAAWLVVTRWRKYSFREMLGWQWNGFKIWHAFVITIFFFGLAIALKSVFPEQENEMDKLINSSRAAVYLVAFFATFTAPIVEEVVYRGVLFSGLQKSFKTPFRFLLIKIRFFFLLRFLLIKLNLLTVKEKLNDILKTIEELHIKYAVQLSIIFVTILFAAIHIPQYSSNSVPDYAAIIVLVMLSLILTMIRVKTKNLLPCIILHTVFNGIQSVLLVLQPWIQPYFENLSPKTQETPAIIFHLLK